MRRRTDNRGSTLIEALAALLIVSITALGGMALYHNASEIKSIAVHKKMVIELANTQMEEYRALSYDDAQLDITGGTAPRTGVAIGGLNVAADDAQGLGMRTLVLDWADPIDGQPGKEIRVDIGWKEVGQNQRKLNVELVTLKMPHET